MASALRTDVGKVRRQNEDAAWLDEERGIFAVADGMGGHLAGEVASGIAVDAVKEMATKQHTASMSALKKMVVKANMIIRRRANVVETCAGMGTTLSVMWRGQTDMYIAHVGDSRVYRFRQGQLEQITRDHSLVAEMVRSGILTKEQARNHPRRNIITRALGTEGNNDPDLLTEDRQVGDLWLLCSDGLSGMVSDDKLSDILKADDLQQMADELLNEALRAGGYDNITLILWRDEGDCAWKA